MANARCRRCNRRLKDPECMEAGYGRTCYSKTFNRPFPSKGRTASFRSTNKTPGNSSSSNGSPAKGEPVEAIPLLAQTVVCKRLADRPPSVNIPHLVTHHSPDGFKWGYAGSGPSELALNILVVYIGEKRALPLHQEFKRSFLEAMPFEGGTIPRKVIVDWLKRHGEEEPYGVCAN